MSPLPLAPKTAPSLAARQVIFYLGAGRVQLGERLEMLAAELAAGAVATGPPADPERPAARQQAPQAPQAAQLQPVSQRQPSVAATSPRAAGVAGRSPRALAADVDPKAIGRALLRCGSCQTIFGLPAGTPPEAAARCPHCSAINKQPPTFAVKLSRLQKRLREQREYLQRQRRQRDGVKLRVTVQRDQCLHSSFSHLRNVPGHVLRTRPLLIQSVAALGFCCHSRLRQLLSQRFSCVFHCHRDCSGIVALQFHCRS